ncbi:hypothetical protein [Stutzerimonas stutzeri]|uniref:hypothetical protein n=1 Tax=Stutzerimonas stutzeri TaxID=316 RepID=UPI0005EBA94A|nr:hypothetical protein [Stutzerimonas stutzeri]
MATVKITFDPASLTPDSECWPAFQAGGMTLKVWALYKRTFLTNQYFKPAIEQLAAYFEEAFDPEKPEVKPYSNIDEFAELLGRCGFRAGGFGCELRGWVVKHWDYFNLNIQKAVTLEYQVVEPVTKRLVVSCN